MKFSEAGEGRLLAWLADEFRPASTGEGVGDDAALLPFGDLTLAVTTDAVVEGVHFRRGWLTWAEMGRRATYACLSDLAAMAARPRAVFLSVGVPPDMIESDLRGFVGAADAAAKEYGAYLAGGDTVGAPTFFADVVAVGEASRPTLRSDGRPGDVLAVTGSLGGPAAAVALLEAGEAEKCGAWAKLRERFVAPRPRVREALALAEVARVAAIDISDGLMLDASRLARASGCRAVLEAAKLPVAAGVEEAASLLGRSTLELAAGGGEEYELLVAMAAEDVQRAPCEMTVVGRLEEGEGAALVGGDGRLLELPSPGWEHR